MSPSPPRFDYEILKLKSFCVESVIIHKPRGQSTQARSCSTVMGERECDGCYFFFVLVCMRVCSLGVREGVLGVKALVGSNP